MLISLILLAIVAAGGMALTYLIENDEPLMWRLSAGTVIGSAIFGTLTFMAASLAGLNLVSASVCLVLTAAPAALLWRRDTRNRFRQDRQRAGGKLQGANAAKFLRFAYYAFFFIVFWLFFERAYFELADGIYTGGSQNLGDLPFHLGAIYSFTDGNNFPPQNPSWAGAKFAYPFISDLLTAAFMQFGADLKNAMFVQNVAWAFSLLVLIERFTVKLTTSRFAGRFAPALLFLSGGLGFLWFFSDYWGSGKAFFDIIWQLPRDYTISDQFRWGNSMVVLFMTQRSLLLGMPLTIIVLGYLWRVFRTDADEHEHEKRSEMYRRYSVPLLIGLIAGMLPLIHLHSLAALFVVTGTLFVIQPHKWREWIAFGIGVALVAVPELVWSLMGAASDTTKFFDWNFGWDKRTDNLLWFWFKNTGILIPLIAAGIYFYWVGKMPTDEKKPASNADPLIDRKRLLQFYIPFALLFLIANSVKLAPWEWDNIKVLIYWFVGSIPLVAYALARVWESGAIGRSVSLVALAVLILAGSLDVWRTVSGQTKMRVFDADGIAIAQQIKRKVDPRAVILNAPTYNSPVVLSGRQSLMRYSGHLSSHGIDYLPRESDVKRIYEGGGESEMLLEKYDIDYVLVSPEERNTLKAKEEFFRKYPVAAEAGQYRLYKIK
jgi:hypothetical protein